MAYCKNETAASKIASFGTILLLCEDCRDGEKLRSFQLELNCYILFINVSITYQEALFLGLGF